ncbi:centromere protein M isoform X3 [Prionailurus iriomotensis]
MSVLRPLDKQPGLNTATILLVGTEDALLQHLADSMLKEDCASELRVHLARSLPLPSSVDRPRIDLIVFVVNLHSKYSLRNVEESLHHVDATFFLGKAAFLATGAGRESHCSVHRNTIMKLAHTYRSPLFFCDLEDAEAWVIQLAANSKGTDSLVPGPGTESPALRDPTPQRLWAPAVKSRDSLLMAPPCPPEGHCLSIEGFRATMAQRLVRMLQICAGHVPGVSALNLLSLLRSSETPAPEDL